MPYYTFDLVVGDEFRNQGTIILEDISLASDRADIDRRELYRTPLDPVPRWRRIG